MSNSLISLSGNKTAVYGGLYVDGTADGNRVMSISQSDVRYYKYGDYPSFNSVTSYRYDVPGYAGITKSISVMNRSGTGGYGISIRGGIITAATDI